MMKTSRCAVWALCLLVLIPLAGCAKKNPLVGTWTGTINIPIGPTQQSLAVTYTFNEDGTCSTSAQTPMGPMNAQGTYTVDDDKLTMKTKTQAQGRTVEGQAEATFKVEGDTLTVTGIPSVPGPIVLQRQK